MFFSYKISPVDASITIADWAVRLRGMGDANTVAVTGSEERINSTIIFLFILKYLSVL